VSSWEEVLLKKENLYKFLENQSKEILKKGRLGAVPFTPDWYPWGSTSPRRVLNVQVRGTSTSL
jgi:hypothetical protein